SVNGHLEIQNKAANKADLSALSCDISDDIEKKKGRYFLVTTTCPERWIMSELYIDVEESTRASLKTSLKNFLIGYLLDTLAWTT
ncbi:hypothetical protein ACJX0J_021772, partial [Zea mays]